MSRHEDEFHRLGQFMLVLTKTFTEQTPRAAALDCSPDFPAGDNAQLGRRALRQTVPVGNETALRKPLALLPHAREITFLTEAHGATQSQAFRRFGGHGRTRVK